MIAPRRLERLHRLRTRLREQASQELAQRAATVVRIETEIASAREAEDAARADAGGVGTGAAVALGWAYADALARRAERLATERAQAAIVADAARDVVLRRRRDEEQLARLGRRVAARVDETVRRADAVHMDELAVRQHGRKS